MGGRFLALDSTVSRMCPLSSNLRIARSISIPSFLNSLF